MVPLRFRSQTKCCLQASLNARDQPIKAPIQVKPFTTIKRSSGIIELVIIIINTIIIITIIIDALTLSEVCVKTK